jgi:hypothetical protein
MISEILNNHTTLKEVNENFDTFMPNCLWYEKSTNSIKEVGRKLKSEYFLFNYIDDRSFTRLHNVSQNSKTILKLYHFQINHKLAHC